MDLDAGSTYRPKTRETQAAYETMLSLVQEKLGDYATDVIAGAADEVLGILKSGHLKVRTHPNPTPLTQTPASPFSSPSWAFCVAHQYTLQSSVSLSIFFLFFPSAVCSLPPWHLRFQCKVTARLGPILHDPHACHRHLQYSLLSILSINL